MSEGNPGTQLLDGADSSHLHCVSLHTKRSFFSVPFFALKLSTNVAADGQFTGVVKIPLVVAVCSAVVLLL